MSYEFFNVVQEKLPRTIIIDFTSPNGDSITRPKDIEDACLAFYHELYTSSGRNELTRQSEQEILNSIPANITPLMALTLSQPLLEPELHRAACALAKEKALGPNGILVNFFTIFRPQIGADFCQMIQNSVSTRRFPKGVTKGLITLIPKSGNLKLLNNQRPIMLLNVGYKIYAKALQMRLQ